MYNTVTGDKSWIYCYIPKNLKKRGQTNDQVFFKLAPKRVLSARSCLNNKNN